MVRFLSRVPSEKEEAAVTDPTMREYGILVEPMTNYTVQFHGIPYVTAGRYSSHREVVAPRAADYEDRFAPYDYPDDLHFNFKEFNSNLVFRWEYSPGSTFFLVRPRSASDLEEEYGRFDAGRDMGNLF